MAEQDSVQDRAAEEPAVDPELQKAPRYNRMTLAEMDLLARLRAAGKTQPQIALALGRSPSTIHEALQRLNNTPDLTKALLAADAVPALQDWRKARRKAAQRGDHRPSREWLEMAHPELRPAPQNQHSMSGGVTIIIGTPQAPLALPDVEVTPILAHGSASRTRTTTSALPAPSLDAPPVVPIDATYTSHQPIVPQTTADPLTSPAPTPPLLHATAPDCTTAPSPDPGSERDLPHFRYGTDQPEAKPL